MQIYMENILADHNLSVKFTKIFSCESFVPYDTINGKQATSVWYIVYMRRQQTGTFNELHSYGITWYARSNAKYTP